MECLNMPHFLFYLLFEYLALAHGKTTFIDNFGDGSLVYGHESSVKSFAKLSSEVVSPLPSQFTICSAINIQTITTMQPFFQVSNWNNVLQCVPKKKRNIRGLCSFCLISPATINLQSCGIF